MSSEFAQRLITQARRLYASESLGVDLTNSVYALDSTTIDLCLSVFPWAHFRSTKSAMKMHMLLDLRGNIPSFIHNSDGKLHDVHALDMLIPEPGAIYVMDRGYIDFARLHALHQTGAFFVTRAKSNLNAHRVYSAATDRSTGVIADQTIALGGARTGRDYPVHLRRIRFHDTEKAKTLIFLTNHTALPALTICDLYKSRWQVELFFQMDQTAPTDQAVLWHVEERRKDTDMDCCFGLCAGGDRAQTAQAGVASLHIAAGDFGDGIRKSRDPHAIFAISQQIRYCTR
jgi:hypothetical protein